MLYWALVIFLELLAIAGSVLLLIPLPLKLRQKIIDLFYSKKYWLLGLIGLFSLLFAQEFTEQAKYAMRRRQATNDQSQFYATETFKHQRNMYIAVLGIVLFGIVFILAKLLKNFTVEIGLLQEQLAVHQRKDQEKKENKED